jgi:predicted MFS family arabinose efflux permease
MGLLMSGLAVRYRHKSLFLIGLGVLCLSALSISVSPSFIIFLAAFALYGASRAIIRPIGLALVGRFFTLEQRPKIAGYMIVGAALAYLFGSALVSLISGWRFMFSTFLLPVTVITLFIAWIYIPSSSSSQSSSHQYRKAFKDVLFNRSALACLIGGVMWRIPANSVMNALSASFFRQTFDVDKRFISLAIIVIAIITIAGSLVGGRLAISLGRKRLTVISSVVLGVITVSFINMPNLWFSLGVWIAGGFFAGIINTTYVSLALEQAPDFRGTMMSLTEVSLNIAQAIGNAFAGLLLLAFNYSIVSLLGLLAIVGALIFQFFTIELREQENESNS